MAINIFSGSSKSSGPKQSGQMGSNAASTSVPVAAGKTATSKLSGIAKTVGGLAAKYGNLIPGVGGIVSTVGKLVSTNDQWWWENVVGTGVSTNIPLASRQDNALIATYSSTSERPVWEARPALAEFVSVGQTFSRYRPKDTEGHIGLEHVIEPTENMISTYLAQNIRKVVNAIPLQSAAAYRDVLTCQATIYAVKHNLDKFIVLAQQSKPFIPAMTDGSFEILKPENYPVLVGLRDRLAEYCKASVRLPHTLCQYLAWRYGRVYRTGTSDKCGLVLYNVIGMYRSLADWTSLVHRLLGFVASSESFFYEDSGRSFYNYWTGSEKLQAQADMYNAYIHHVNDVEIKPDTQFIYDPKEFVLRTNLDAIVHTSALMNYPRGFEDTDKVYMDSLLDNKTTFMSSTVSTRFRSDPYNVLFPVSGINIYGVGKTFHDNFSPLILAKYPRGDSSDPLVTFRPLTMVNPLTSWWRFNMDAFIGSASEVGTDDTNKDLFMGYIFAASMCKSLEIYNKEVFIDMGGGNDGNYYLDLTAFVQDLAIVSSEIMQNTQVYAFANLVHVDVTSYSAKEAPKVHEATTAAVKEIANSVTPNGVTPVSTLPSGQKVNSVAPIPAVPQPT